MIQPALVKSETSVIYKLKLITYLNEILLKYGEA